MNHESLMNSNIQEAEAIKKIIIALNPKILIQGCSESEIDLLESTLNISLPYSYRIFLLFFGHGDGCGYFFDDMDWTYEFIVESNIFLRELVNDILIENTNSINISLLDIPKEFIVIASLYNEYFYLITTDNDKQSVYFWDRTNNKIIAEYNTIWILIKHNIQQITNIYRKP
jgi:SMI1-KNR4 cell-wall